MIVPGKLVMDLVHNRVVRIVRYGEDAAGRYVEVRLYGSYGAHVRLPLSCIRALTLAEKEDPLVAGWDD